MAICSGARCFETVARRGWLCRGCRIAAGVDVCSVRGCASKGLTRGICLKHWRAAKAAGTLPPIRRRVRVRVVETKKIYTDPDRAGHEGPTASELRRGRTRRAIEDKQEALRRRREDALLSEGDW